MPSRPAPSTPVLAAIAVALTLGLVPPLTAVAQPCASYAEGVPPPLGVFAQEVGVLGVAVAGHRGYVVGSGGLQVLDLSDPLAPVKQGLVALRDGGPPMGQPKMVVADGDLVLVGYNTRQGWLLIDARDPWAPIVRSLPLPWKGWTEYPGIPALAGNRVYTAWQPDYDGGHSNIIAIDISDPAAPQLLGSYHLEGEPCQMLVVDGLVCLAGVSYRYPPSGYLWFLDFSEPTAPVVRSTLAAPTLTLALNIAVEGTTACLTIWDDAGFHLQFVDISDPAQPRELGRSPLPNMLSWLVLGGGIAYGRVDPSHELVPSTTLAVCDFRVPTAPIALATVELPSSGLGLAVGHDGLWVTAGEDGLLLLPRECSATVPVLVSGFRAEPMAGGVDLAWRAPGAAADRFRLDRVQADGRSEVPFRDLGGGLFAAEDRAPLLRAGGRFTYVLDHRGEDGTWTALQEASVQLSPPALPAVRLEAAPNPFNPATTITFALERPGRVRLSVHDLAGRPVAILVDAALAAGHHATSWDGRDRAGRQLPSAGYVLRLETEQGAVVARKLALLR